MAITDLTWVRSDAGWTDAAVVFDVVNRLIVGWQCRPSSDQALYVLDTGLWTRQQASYGVTGLVHHK